MDHKEEKIESLYRLITSLSSVEDCKALFEDLCTNKELEKMAERVYAARLLLEVYVILQMCLLMILLR